MIQNAFEGKWEGPPAAQLLADSVSRSRLMDKILNLVATYQFKGITIDFEDLPADAHKDFQTFLAELSASLHERGLVLVLAVPFSDSNWPYETYATIADFLLLMAYDEHYPEGSPGSIAGRKWFTDNLDKQMKILRPDRTIISIGNYGYDWVDAHSAESITFQDAMKKWWSLLPLVVVQRFCYRQLLYWVAIRSSAAAIKGKIVGWGKLQRTGKVVFVNPALEREAEIRRQRRSR